MLSGDEALKTQGRFCTKHPRIPKEKFLESLQMQNLETNTSAWQVLRGVDTDENRGKPSVSHPRKKSLHLSVIQIDVRMMHYAPPHHQSVMPQNLKKNGRQCTKELKSNVQADGLDTSS